MAEHEADDGNDQSPEQGGEEAIDTKPKVHSLGNPTRQEEHQRVDDEREQAQRQAFEEQRNHADDWADHGIGDAEDQRHDQQGDVSVPRWVRTGRSEVNTGHDPRGD